LGADNALLDLRHPDPVGCRFVRRGLVGVCWLGTILSRPFVKPWFHEQSRLNEILGDYLQYFGVIYGLLLGLLAVATYQNHTDVEKAVASERRCASSMSSSRIDGRAFSASPQASRPSCGTRSRLER
jgi:hypothetical protein